MLALGVDVRYAPTVAQHGQRLLETPSLRRAANHGEGCLRPAFETVPANLLGGLRAWPRGHNHQAEKSEASLHAGDILSREDQKAAARTSFFTLFRVLRGESCQMTADFATRKA